MWKTLNLINKITYFSTIKLVSIKNYNTLYANETVARCSLVNC